MKKYIVTAAVLFNAILIFAQTTPPPPPAPPAPPVSPTIKISGDVVTISTENGDVFVIDDNGVRKNGKMIVGDSEDLRDAIDDLQDEIDDITSASASVSPGSEDYEDLMDDLNDLQDELAELNVTVQIDTLPGDSTSVTIGKWRLIVKEEENEGDDVDVSFEKVPDVEEVDDRDVDVFDTEWFLFDMGYNTYLNADHKVQVDAPYSDLEDLHGWGSFDVNLHIFRSRVNMFNGYMNFNYGLSMEWHHFRYDRDFTILPDMDSLTIVDEPTFNYDKNKFNTTHVSVPLLLGFETKPWDTDNSFRVMFGYDPGLMLRGKTKHKINGNADVEKDDFNLAQFRHEADFIIGYGEFNLYASYDINSMFAEGEGPELHPFSVGLVIRRGF